jgi:hypothetical protein
MVARFHTFKDSLFALPRSKWGGAPDYSDILGMPDDSGFRRIGSDIAW